MLDCFSVVSSSGGYGVEIGPALSSTGITACENQVVICDRYFSKKYIEIGFNVIGVDAFEESKSLDQMSAVILALRKFGANRETIIIAVGGGVIQDIATFVASVYMRGLSWSYFPTTLLGMVDSCIGGKSSINVGKYKNLIGSFYPPDRICIDLQFINTLTAEQRVAGLFEAVKICFASSEDVFDQFIKLNMEANSSAEKFHALIKLTLVAKKWFIEVDEYDKKERQLLNFGHTFGHAIEGAGNFSIPHGIAVGIGMLAAIKCARLTGQFDDLPPRVVLLERYVKVQLATVSSFLRSLEKISSSDLMDSFCMDKKHNQSHFYVIVPDEAGRLVRLGLEKSDTNRALISSTFTDLYADAIL